MDADAHGGLTYSDPCQEGGKICHVPQAGESETVWWLGFDCAHYGDLSPGFRSGLLSGGDYKSVAYVRREVERLADQAQRVAKGLPAREEE